MSFSHVGEWDAGDTGADSSSLNDPNAFSPAAATRNRDQRRCAINDDVRAIAAALSLCLFLWALKVVLIVWSIRVKQINPLADAPMDGAIAFGGEDLFLCTGLAVVYRMIFAVGNRGPRWWRWLLGFVGTYAIHIAVVIFSVASFEVARIYGWPLLIDHLRTASDPRIIRSSVGAYSGLVPCLLIALGILARPVLGSAMQSLLGRIAARRSARLLWLIFLSTTAILMVLWSTRLRKVDTFGVKENAVIFFIQHYQRAPGPIQVRQTLVSLSKQLSSDDRHTGQAASLLSQTAMLKRDFSLPADLLAKARGMNVLFIQLESTSAAHLDEQTTPTLMKLARSGLSFENHATVYAETTRATYGIYYSDYLTDLGTMPRMIYGKRLPQTSLIEVAHDAGYQTALFHSGFLSYAGLDYLFENKGLDTIVDAQNLWTAQADKKAPLPWSWGVREEQTVAALTGWISSHHGKSPFFAVYATEFPHHPYLCPIDDKPFPETSWLNRYRNSLHYADRCVGLLIDNLAKMGQLDNTLIVVTGDHGETVSSYPVGHGLVLTREEIFTPFILSNPRLFPASETSRLSSNHLDIAPTVCRLMGFSPAPDWLGRDLLSDDIPARSMFMGTKLTQIQGVIDNGMLYVYETSRHRGQMFDTSSGAEHPIHRDDLLPRYQALNETFQKWAVWHHLSRANDLLSSSAAMQIK